MNYHNITKCDQNNGDGLRVTLWVSGCSHKCKDCQNPQTWDYNSGIEYTQAIEQEVFTELDKSYISGLTLSGGDPLSPLNLPIIFSLVQKVKSKYPNKTIWCYTGYLFEQIDKEILKYIDVLVDGKYDYTKRDITLKWCGSSNQRIINVKESLKNDRIILL